MQQAPDQAHHHLSSADALIGGKRVPKYAVSDEKRAEVDRNFTYQPPREDQLPRYNAIREQARNFAQTILELTPASADQSAAIRLLRECVMTANASIALEQGVPTR